MTIPRYFALGFAWLSLAPGAFSQPPGQSSSGVRALAGNGSTWTPVQQLANRVRKVIKLVEENPTLTCEMRNHLVKRLRSLDDALEAGKRSAAAALVKAWTGEARSYQRAGLLSAAHGAILHNGLQGFVEEIGTGWPKKPGPTRKWDPLPACDSGETSVPAATLAATPPPTGCPALPDAGSWDSSDTLTVLTTVLGEIPEVGGMLSGILEILWPSSGSSDVSAIIDRTLDCVTQKNASESLISLQTRLGEWSITRDNWTPNCAGNPKATEPVDCMTATSQLYSSWAALNSDIEGYRIFFQTTDQDHQLMLLPLYAQYETLYMSFLRDGILLAQAWIDTGTIPDNAGRPAAIMREDLNPAFVDTKSGLGSGVPDRGVHYVNTVYERGLDTHPEPTPTGNQKWKTWTERNAYIRDMTLKVLDLRDTWKFMDADVYPEGAQGGVKLTRMIYSDPVGHMFDTDFASFQPPGNVSGPLKELTVWSQRHNLEFNGGEWVISALQSTNPPTVGPARSGEITGDATHDGTTTATYLDLRVGGPIREVRTDTGFKGLYENQLIPAKIDFRFGATNQWIHTGSEGNQITQSWIYPGHVLAAAKAMGIYNLGKDTSGTQSVIFGFRLYDSFLPSGALVSVASGSCMNVAPLTAGAQPNVSSCSGVPGQIWTYDTNTKAVKIGDPGLCLRATSGSAVVIGACSGANNEQWALVPSPTGLSGMVKSVQYGTVLTVAGTAISLSAAAGPNGSAYQQWKATSPLQGEVHGVGSGRCLGVMGTANGSPVQIWDCNGTAGQTWTYDESKRTLSLYNGTKCLQPSANAIGAMLVISDCSTSAPGLQQWVFNRDRTITHVPTGYVLDVLGGSMTNMSIVGLASLASPVSPSQQWSRPSRLGGNVHATHAGKCLEVPDLTNGRQAQISECLASPAPTQEWTYHPLTQRITAHGDGTEHCLSISGSAVVVTSCQDDPNQLWRLKDYGIGGTIISTPSINAAKMLCMTLPGTAEVTASGTKVEVQECAKEGVVLNNQQWIWP